MVRNSPARRSNCVVKEPRAPRPADGDEQTNEWMFKEEGLYKKTCESRKRGRMGRSGAEYMRKGLDLLLRIGRR